MDSHCTQVRFAHEQDVLLSSMREVFHLAGPGVKGERLARWEGDTSASATRGHDEEWWAGDGGEGREG